LDELVRKGYRLRAHYRSKISAEEAEAKGLPENYIGAARAGKLKAAVLHGPQGQGVLHFFYDAETMRYLQSHIDRAHANASGGIYILFSISFLQIGQSTHYNLDNVLTSMKELFGAEVKRAELGGNLFEVFLVNLPADEFAQRAVLKSFEEKLMLLSLLYRAGMFVHYYDFASAPEGEFLMGSGPEEQASTGFRPADLDQLTEVLKNEKAFKAAQSLQAFYRQTTKVGRLALGWMALEELFGDVGITAHLLKKHERKEFEQLVADGLGIDPDRKKKLIDCFRASNTFRRSRNDIMADRIAELTGEEWPGVREKIAQLSKARAKVVHSFASEDEIDINVHEQFIEGTLHRYILRESGIKVVNIRGY
jgi:hypothetical protein